MPEAKQVTFTYKELSEVLVKKLNLHEGIWGIYIEFAIQGANIKDPGGQVLPSAVVPVVKIGIQRMDEVNSISVDAALVNPAPDR